MCEQKLTFWTALTDSSAGPITCDMRIIAYECQCQTSKGFLCLLLHQCIIAFRVDETSQHSSGSGYEQTAQNSASFGTDLFIPHLCRRGFGVVLIKLDVIRNYATLVICHTDERS